MEQAKPNKIFIITTGGTIEKSYCEANGSLLNKESFIKDILSYQLRLPTTEIEVIPLLSKDSLDLSDSDRNLILSKVQELSLLNLPVVVLHGTDTLEITAQLCQRNLRSLQAPVIFTGAMTPININRSDALQNVTEALSFAKALPPLVYISFHGEVFEGHMASKDRELSTFVGESFFKKLHANRDASPMGAEVLAKTPGKSKPF